jgi:hypothetical protein
MSSFQPFLGASFTQPSSQPYSFSLNTPSFNMGLNTPSFNMGIPPPSTRMVADQSNFSSKFKNPVHTEVIKLKSESSNKSYNGLYHTFILPNIGDYAHGFNLNSLYLLKAVKDQTLLVDCVGNYIDCVTLNLNNSITTFSRIDGVGRVEVRSPSELSANSISTIKLDFLDLPLLTRYSEGGSFQISIKFSQPPPLDYELTYEVMFSDDKSYMKTLHNEDFSILYQSRQANCQKKAIEMIHRGGKITLK